jgi:hypothetical protein
MTKTEHAIEVFEEGCDCDQAVLAAFEQELHVDPTILDAMIHKESIALGTPHPDCGVVIGACSVIKMCDKCKEGKASEEELLERFKVEFLKRNKSLRCKELLGYDLSNMSDLIQVMDNDLCEKKCEHYISDAVEILDTLVH